MAYSPIKIKPSKVGSLHKLLNVPQKTKIPAGKLSVKSTDSPAMKKKKQFAQNAKKFNHSPAMSSMSKLMGQ